MFALLVIGDAAAYLLVVRPSLQAADKLGGSDTSAALDASAGSGGEIGLVVCESDLDLGDVVASRALRAMIRARNSGRDKIEIDEVRPSCACTCVTPRAATLAPGQRIEFVATLDVSPRNAAHSAMAQRPVTVTLALHVRHCGWVRWQLRARVQSPFTVVPSIVDVGQALIHGTRFETAKVHVEAHDPVSSVRAACDSRLALASVRKLDANGRKFELEVTPRSDLALGPFEFDVRLTPVGSPSPARGATVVRVVGRVVEDLECLPPSLLLRTRVSESSTKEITVRSRSGAPLHRVDFAVYPPQGVSVVSIAEHGPGVRRFAIASTSPDATLRASVTQHQIRLKAWREGDSAPMEEIVHVVIQRRAPKVAVLTRMEGRGPPEVEARRRTPDSAHP